jgi:hypothetical protein
VKAPWKDRPRLLERHLQILGLIVDEALDQPRLQYQVRAEQVAELESEHDENENPQGFSEATAVASAPDRPEPPFTLGDETRGWNGAL